VRVVRTPGGFDVTVVGLAEYTTPTRPEPWSSSMTAPRRRRLLVCRRRHGRQGVRVGLSEDVCANESGPRHGPVEVLTKTQIVTESGVDDSVDLVTYV